MIIIFSSMMSNMFYEYGTQNPMAVSCSFYSLSTSVQIRVGWSFYYLLKDFFIIWAWTSGPFLGIGKVVASDVF